MPGERLKEKVAIVVGAGQTPGDTIGNGRATAIVFAREGAKVLCIDRMLDRAEETVELIRQEGGEASAYEADITREAECEAVVRVCLERYGRIDILHNNVGIGTGDGPPTRVTAEAWDRIFEVNLKGMWLMSKHVVPVMREQESGSIINISSAAAVLAAGITAYEASKAGVNALTRELAMSNARYGVRANVIMPGLMDTPMAIEGIAAARGIPKEELRAQRNSMVPLRGRMGTGWDTAYAALYLASDEANFVTGVILPVDGGQAANAG